MPCITTPVNKASPRIGAGSKLPDWIAACVLAPAAPRG
jgi:hypothetical protein